MGVAASGKIVQVKEMLGNPIGQTGGFGKNGDVQEIKENKEKSKGACVVSRTVGCPCPHTRNIPRLSFYVVTGSTC